MDFRILGPLEVLVGGTSVSLGGQRYRRLLAALVVNAGHVVPVDRLIDALWAEDPPKRAPEMLHARVSELRRTLRMAGVSSADLLVTRRPGYLLDLGPDQIDARRFEAIAADGRRALDTGNLPAGAAILRQALRLWRGPALSDVADLPFARPEAARLDTLRLQVLEHRLDAELAIGRHGDASAELESLVAEHPFRERFWVQLMLALYRSGRQGEALGAYQRARRLLLEELGIDPGSDLQEMEAAILRQDPGLALGPTLEPDPVLRATGDGVVRAARSVADQQARRSGLGALPLPNLMRRMDDLPMVGRKPELATLDAARHDAASRTVFIGGEPGAGKTRLVAELAAEAHAEGAFVLAGRCDDGMAVPYQPFVEALRHLVDHSSDAELVHRLGRWPGELSRLVPEIRTRMPTSPPPLKAEPETERYRLFDAVTSWMAATSAERPLVFVADDLHWATKPTLFLLRHVLRSGELMRLSVWATYRDTELSPSHPLAGMMADLRAETGVTVLTLPALDVSEVRELVAAASDGCLTSEADWAVPIYADTRGNPLYVTEVARYIVQSDGFDGVSPAPRSVVELGIPESLQEVVSRRICRLGGATVAALRTASVAGLEFDPVIVERASGLDEEALVSALEEATAARLIEEVPGDPMRYRFSHALVRASVYGGITRMRRTVLHRHLGEAIEAVHRAKLVDSLPELAHHFAEAAGGRPDAKAASYARRAGDAALAQFAHDEAVGHYRAALGLMDAREDTSGLKERCEVLISLGEAEARAGESSFRQTLLEAADLAERLGDSERLARAALSINRGRYGGVGHPDRERVMVLQAALDAYPGEDSAVRARLLAQLGAELVWSGEWNTRAALSDDAVAMARRIDDPGILAFVLHLRFVTVWAGSTLPERRALACEAQALADRVGDRTLAFFGAYTGCHLALETGDIETADRLLVLAERHAEGLHQPLLRWRVLYTNAVRAVIAGDLEEGERLALQAVGLGRSAGQPDAARIFAAQLFTVRLHQGRLGEVVDLPERDFSETGDHSSLPWLSQMALALAYSEMNHSNEARRIFDALISDGLGDLPSDFGWLPAVALGALVCSSLKDVPVARRIYELLEPYADQCIFFGPSWLGSTAHYLGLLAATMGDLAQAGHDFAHAADVHSRAQSPVWQAHTQLAWGGTLFAGGDGRAREIGAGLLGEARATAERLGMARVVWLARRPMAAR